MSERNRKYVLKKTYIFGGGYYMSTELSDDVDELVEAYARFSIAGIGLVGSTWTIEVYCSKEGSRAYNKAIELGFH